jgi:pyridoxal phosphate enzyme (YggS family)
MSIAENVAKILSQIETAAIAAGRDPKEITLCAATKMNGSDAVREAIQAGIRCCGENRVQELTAKLADNAYAGADIHFIGHLQTNKVKQVIGKVSLIQSVDSLRLLQAVSKEAVRQSVQQDILLEINIGEEASKTGFSIGDILPLLDNFVDYPNVRVRGLMAIPPICENPGDNDKFFEEIRTLAVDIKAKKYDNVCMEILSMGMSDDFADAIAHGSTMIRIGTAIFGARNYAPAHPAG